MWNYIIQDFFQSRRNTFLLLFIIFIGKLFYSIGLGIVPDEAYYWEWSRNLDLSYYDQGPGTGYFIRLFTLFLGDTLFALKFGANLSSLLTAFLIYLTGRRIGLDGYQLFWLILLINIAPGLMGGSFLIMHDSPLVLCWSAGIYVSILFLQTLENKYLYLLFLLLGLGGISKHTMLFFVFGILLWVLFNPKEWKIFKNIHLYFGVLLTALIISPMIYWNYKTGWHNVDAIVNLRSAGGNSTQISTGKFIAGQLISFSPLWFLAALFSIYIWGKKNIYFLKFIGIRDTEIDLKSERTHSFLFWNAIILPLFFFIMSFRKEIQGNWVFPSYLSGIILLSGLISVNPVLKREKVINSLLKFGLIFAIPISIFILFSSSLLNLFNIKMEPYYVPGYRTKGFYEIAKKVENLKKEIDPDAIVIANRYQDAAILSWYLEGQPFVKSFNIMQKNQYNLWSSPSKGKNYLLVHIQENTCEKSFVFFQPYLELMFDSIREFPEEDITYDGATIKRYQVWYLQNYKKEWSTGLQNYLREDYLNVLLPSLTLNKEIKVDKDLFQKGVNMMSSYHNRAGEVDCKIFK